MSSDADADIEREMEVFLKKFTYFAGDPYDQNLKILQSQNSVKPQGLWFVPCKNWSLWFAPFNWIEWCKEDWFFNQKHRYQYGIESIDSLRILQILTIKDVEDCIEKYLILTSWGTKQLNWHQICQDFAGVFISYSHLSGKTYNLKYQPFDILISTLDVDSLVVWDHSILRLNLLKYCETGIQGF
jgi:hypothetical protein